LIVAAVILLAAVAVGPTVGMEGRAEVTIPGPLLEAKPVQDKAPLILRVASTQPTDAGAVRYDLRYIGLVPGKHDLKRYLVRADGSPTDDVPAIPVEVAHLLPELHKGDLVAQDIQPLGFLGGYRGLMTAAVVVWLLLLVPLVFLRRKRRNGAVAAPPAPAPTLADRMRPLVEQAADGTLSVDGKGQLERMLLGYWRQRLDLRQADMAESLVRLRRHPDAGLLLHALEDWLHRPPGSASIDVAAVLAPYRNVPADAVAAVETNGEGRRVA
jgi:hypothetical protein